jgi:hypothetical protein
MSFSSNVIKLESDKLKYYSDKTNEIYDKDVNENLFVNLSVTTIIHKIFSTFVDILNDLAKTNSPKEMLSSFIKGDRLIYVGIIGVIIAFCMYVIDISGNG